MSYSQTFVFKIIKISVIGKLVSMKVNVREIYLQSIYISALIMGCNSQHPSSVGASNTSAIVQSPRYLHIIFDRFWRFEDYLRDFGMHRENSISDKFIKLDDFLDTDAYKILIRKPWGLLMYFVYWITVLRFLRKLLFLLLKPRLLFWMLQITLLYFNRLLVEGDIWADSVWTLFKQDTPIIDTPIFSYDLKR